MSIARDRRDSAPPYSVISGMQTGATNETDIIKAHDAQVRRLARRFAVQVDDLTQIGRLALLEAARAWATKPEHTAQFWTYAYKRVFGAMMNHVTREISRARVELDAEMMPQPFASPDLVAEAHEHLAALTVQQAAIVASHVEGNDVRSIAEEMGDTSKSVVHRTLAGALENIRERA